MLCTTWLDIPQEEQAQRCTSLLRGEVCFRGMIATFRPASTRHDYGWTVYL